MCLSFQEKNAGTQFSHVSLAQIKHFSNAEIQKRCKEL